MVPWVCEGRKAPVCVDFVIAASSSWYNLILEEEENFGCYLVKIFIF